MKKNLSHIINTMFVPIVFVFSIWFVKGFELIIELNFHNYSMTALNLKNLKGILTFPFIHADFSHLINNSYPILILGGIISSIYKTISNKVFFLSYILSGTILWLIGDPHSNVIGSSGVVYALGSFILVSGFIKKQPRLAILSFLVIFLNFFNLWGIIEIKGDNISQIAHLSGAIAGVIIAIIFRSKGPQPKKYNYEIEEEREAELKENQKEQSFNYVYKKNNNYY